MTVATSSPSAAILFTSMDLRPPLEGEFKRTLCNAMLERRLEKDGQIVVCFYGLARLNNWISYDLIYLSRGFFRIWPPVGA